MDLNGLLERFLAEKDEDAMAMLVRRTRPRLLAAARRICSAEAEDSVQTAYLALVRKGDVPDAPLIAWLLTTVVRISYRRRAQRNKEHAIAEQLAPGKGPLPHAALQEELALLRREVDRLPDNYRDPLILFYLQGLSHTETARILDLQESTLRTRLQRGRFLLRSRLSPKILYPVLALPWLFADHASAAVIGGLIMKSKAAALVALVVVLLLAGGMISLATRERASAPRATPEARSNPAVPYASRAATIDAQPGEAVAAAPGARRFAAGIVVDESDAPIEGVGVCPRGLEEDIVGRLLGEDIDDEFRARPPVAMSDSDGRFVVRAAATGFYSLVFLKAGYVGTEIKCASKDSKLDAKKGIVHLDVQSPGDEMRVILPPARTVTGVVRDTAGQPVRRGRVMAVSRRPAVWQTTWVDGAGRYSFHSVGENLKNMTATAGGYNVDRREEHEIGATVDFRLSRRFLLIDVSDVINGKPVEARGIEVDVESGRFLSGLDSHGFHSLGAALWAVPGRIYSRSLVREPKKARVFVFAPGYRPTTETVEYRPGEEPPHLRVKLMRGVGTAVIAGVVKGAPHAHVEVRYAQHRTRAGYPVLADAEINAAGHFAFSGLPPGKYYLDVTAEDLGRVRQTIHAPALDLMVRLETPATVEVIAKDAAGAPVAGTAIHLEPVKGTQFWNQTTGPDGRAIFDQIPPGDVRLAPVIEGYAHRMLELRWRATPYRAVTLEPGQRTTLELRVPARVPFTLSVEDEHGAPLAGRGLLLKPRGGFVTVVGGSEWKRLSESNQRTDSAGKFSFDLFPGDYDVTVSDGAVKHTRQVKVAADSRQAEIVIPRSGITLRGRVRDMTTSQPLPACSVKVHVLSPLPQLIVETRTGEDGSFAVAGLSRGDVWVAVDPRTKLQIVMPERATHPPAHRRVELSGDLDLDVVLPRVRGDGTVPRASEVAVSARAGGAPEPDAHCQIWALLGDCWVDMGRKRVDEHGQCVLAVVKATRYRISSYTQDRRHVEQEFDRADIRTEITVDLTK